jgi:hypothetical protein
MTETLPISIADAWWGGQEDMIVDVALDLVKLRNGKQTSTQRCNP